MYQASAIRTLHVRYVCRRSSLLNAIELLVELALAKPDDYNQLYCRCLRKVALVVNG